MFDPVPAFMVDHNVKSFQRREENIKLLSQYLDTYEPISWGKEAVPIAFCGS